MPRTHAAKEHPSFPELKIPTRENQDPQASQIGKPPPARDQAPHGLRASGAATALSRAAANSGLLGRPTRVKPKGDQRGQEPRDAVDAVPCDGWRRELDDVIVNFCKRGRQGQREAILAIRKQHPQISAETIWARMLYLGQNGITLPEGVLINAAFEGLNAEEIYARLLKEREQQGLQGSGRQSGSSLASAQPGTTAREHAQAGPNKAAGGPRTERGFCASWRVL